MSRSVKLLVIIVCLWCMLASIYFFFALRGYFLFFSWVVFYSLFARIWVHDVGYFHHLNDSPHTGLSFKFHCCRLFLKLRFFVSISLYRFALILSVFFFFFSRLVVFLWWRQEGIDGNVFVHNEEEKEELSGSIYLEMICCIYQRVIPILLSLLYCLLWFTTGSLGGGSSKKGWFLIEYNPKICNIYLLPNPTLTAI